MGGKSTTVSGLSGLGDIMLTCYGSLSRNRSVGIRLGKGEQLEDILATSTQVGRGWEQLGKRASRCRTSWPPPRRCRGSQEWEHSCPVRVGRAAQARWGASATAVFVRAAPGVTT